MKSQPSSVLDRPDPRSSFENTPWTAVVRAGGEPVKVAGAALEALCQAYDFPVYAFIRHHGMAHSEAGDLTRRFFAQLLESGGTPHGDPERSRFRTFLLTAVSVFLADARRSTAAAGHESDDPADPIEFPGAALRLARDPIDPEWTPEEAFDHHWAMITIERAIGIVQTECAASHHGPLLDALGPFVWGGSATPSQAEAAAGLGITEHAFTVAVHRLRHRLREHLRALVAATVADPAEMESELRFLLAVVRRRPAAG